MTDIQITKHTDKNTPLFLINGNNYICKIVNIIQPNIIKVVFKPYDTYIKVNLKINNLVLYKDNTINDKGFKFLFYLLTNTQFDNYNNVIHYFNNNDIIFTMIALYFDKEGYLIADIYDDKKNKTISQLMLESETVKKYLK
tara:strand:+ start:683 stop:1105 length:423 start_codon:yes stop_codon:yes gene_type:complete